MNSGPGKSPGLPMPDCAIASSAAISASRCDSSGALIAGSTATKSTVPAMRVFSPSVAKRVISRMPDWPARQLRPVVLSASAERGHDAIAGDDDDRTTAWSACHRSLLQLDGLEQRETFAAPVADARHHGLPQRTCRIAPSIARLVGSAGQTVRRAASAAAASAMLAGNCGSSPWPKWVPVARTARPWGCEKVTFLGGRGLQRRWPPRSRPHAPGRAAT